MPRLVQRPQAGVDADEILRADEAAEFGILIRAHLIVVNLIPRQVEPDWTLVLRANSILPIVTGDIIPAGPPHHRDVQVFDQLNKIRPEPVRVCQGRFGVINRAIDHRAYRLKKTAVDVGVHFTDFSVQINLNDRRLVRPEIPGDEAGEKNSSEKEISRVHKTMVVI